MNQATDIVRQRFQHHFIDLRSQRLATHRIAKHAFDRREGRFDVRALVIRRQEFFAVQDEVSEQPIPCLRRRSAVRQVLERNERFRALVHAQFEVGVGTVGLIAQYAGDVEVIRGLADQRREKRRIVCVLLGRFNGRDDVGFHAADSVNLNPIVLATNFVCPVFFFLPEADQLRAGEVGRINRKLSFHRLEWSRGASHQDFDNRRNRLRSRHLNSEL
jgi:hypothetical protein